jgi:acyl carrier protein
VPATVETEDVVAMLAAFGDRRPEDVPDDVGSLEAAWLVHQVEQRYGVTLDLSDEELTRMTTVSNAVDVLRAAMDARV